MYGKLVLGAVISAVAPQQSTAPQDTVPQVIRVPGVEIEVPAIEIPEIDMYLPGFEIHVPTFQFEERVGGHGMEVHVPQMVFELPAIAWVMPEIEFPITVGWQDWSWDDESRTGLQDIETDTTFAVNPSATLGVRNHAGEIVVRTWDRNEVRVVARHSSRDRVKIFQSRTAVEIKSETRHGHPDVVDYTITVPRTMALDLWGFTTDISVDGARNDVRVETMQGDISVIGAEGVISLRSVEGGINVRSSRGALEINGVEDDILVIDFEGELFAESIDGDIRLEDIRSGKLEAKTVDGDVHFAGSIRDEGRYRLTTHDGDITVILPGEVNAEISVATFDGEFVPNFPIRLQRAEASRRFSFILGNGGARIELHSFDGDIHMLRR